MRPDGVVFSRPDGRPLDPRADCFTVITDLRVDDILPELRAEVEQYETHTPEHEEALRRFAAALLSGGASRLVTEYGMATRSEVFATLRNGGPQSRDPCAVRAVSRVGGMGHSGDAVGRGQVGGTDRSGRRKSTDGGGLSRGLVCAAVRPVPQLSTQVRERGMSSGLPVRRTPTAALVPRSDNS